MYGVWFQLNCATIVPRIIVLGSWFMKKILGIVLVGIFLCGNAFATKRVNITIKELVDNGYKLTHTDSRGDYLYLIFENGNDIYSCAGTHSGGFSCVHLTDGTK